MRFQKAGATLPPSLVVDFERYLKHYWQAQRQARYSEDGSHGRLTLSEYIAEKLRCRVRNDGLVVKVSVCCQVNSYANNLAHSIQGTEMLLRSGESIQCRGSQSIATRIRIEFLAETPDVLRPAILDRQHSAEEEEAT